MYRRPALRPGEVDWRAAGLFDRCVRGVMEVVGTLALLAGAVGAFTAVRAAPASRGARRFWLLSFAGLTYFTLDELFSLHERLGLWLFEHGVPDPPGFHHLDDAIVALVGLAGLAVIAAHGSTLREARGAGLVFLAGVVLFGIAAAFDVFAPIHSSAAFYAEEGIEVAGALTMGASGLWAAGWRLGPRRIPAPHGSPHRPLP